jgi:hypothetical protein
MAVLFKGRMVYINDHHGTTVMTGTLDPSTELYMIHLHDRNALPGGDTPQKHRAASAHTIKTLPALINFYHYTLGAPPISTWLRGIKKGWFSSWPGLTYDRAKQHCTPKPQTAYGHLQLLRQHVNSTKDKPRHRLRSRIHDVEVHVVENNVNNNVAMDLPGRLPITSRRGNKYIFLMIDHDTNYINAIPIKSRKSSELVNAYNTCCEEMKAAGFQARLLRLDNEVSKELIEAIGKQAMDYQIASPGDHRTNPAERAIRDFKAHFISVRSGTDPDYPANAWDQLLPHVIHTLNMLRPSKINPQVSAHTMMKGHHDYNSHPIAPAGCKIVIHERRNERGSWANHGTDGFYISQAPNHYRNFTCYIPSTGMPRISNTVEFFPAHGKVPYLSTTETIALILKELKELLQSDQTTQFQTDPTKLRRAITALQSLLNATEKKNRPIRSSKGETPHRLIRTEPARYPNGTIIRKKFNKGWYEGEVTGFDPSNSYYKIRYTDGDTEEFDHQEVKEYKKKVQAYTSRPTNDDQLTTRARYYAQLGRLQAKRTNSETKVKQHQWALRTKKTHKSTFGNNVMHFAYSSWVRRKHQAHKAGSIWDENLKKWMSLRDLLKHPDPSVRTTWERSSCKEYGGLFQGHGDTKGKDVCKFIKKEDVPPGKKVTYPRTTVAFRPEKDDPNRTRITAGGDQLDYDGETATQSASMVTIKVHWNSVLSDLDAKYCCADASNMYLETVLPEAQYVRFKIDEIPRTIQEQYDLSKLVHNGYVYAQINKAWYGLKESGKLANDDMVKVLEQGGYIQSRHTSGLFTHETRDISFTLVVDDFGIKYKKQEDVDHLMACLRKKYTMKVDMEAKQYVGIDLKWDYNARELICSMDAYVKSALSEFQHEPPKQHHYGPSKSERPVYGAKVQYVKTDTSAPLPPDKIRYIQRVVGKFLFMGRALDNTMLHALNDIACAVTKGTQATLNATTYFLNYIASNPLPRVRYRASEMILHVESDAAYLVCPEARSRAGGYHYLGSRDGTNFNAPIFVQARVIKNVMASAAEAEVAALYLNAQEALPIRQCLIDLGHPQPATRMNTDNQTATGILRGTIKQKRSKAIDMRFYWLRDRQEQGQFDIKWVPGKHNLADYHTKHHPGSHHKKVRPIYLYEGETSPKTLQGCIEILTKTGEGQGKTRTSAHSSPRRSALASLKHHTWSLAEKYSRLTI